MDLSCLLFCTPYLINHPLPPSVLWHTPGYCLFVCDLVSNIYSKIDSNTAYSIDSTVHNQIYDNILFNIDMLNLPSGDIDYKSRESAGALIRSDKSVLTYLPARPVQLPIILTSGSSLLHVNITSVYIAGRFFSPDHKQKPQDCSYLMAIYKLKGRDP